MYYIAMKDGAGRYYIDQTVEDWHDAVDGFEPIDCLDGEMIIYDEHGHKFLVGPHKELSKEKLFWKVSVVDVGSWDFAKGEPFLVDTKETSIDELNELLKDYKQHK
jgi:hypothetical protein